MLHEYCFITLEFPHITFLSSCERICCHSHTYRSISTLCTLVIGFSLPVDTWVCSVYKDTVRLPVSTVPHRLWCCEVWRPKKTKKPHLHYEATRKSKIRATKYHQKCLVILVWTTLRSFFDPFYWCIWPDICWWTDRFHPSSWLKVGFQTVGGCQSMQTQENIRIPGLHSFFGATFRLSQVNHTVLQSIKMEAA